MTYPEKKSVYFAYPLYGHSGTQDDPFFGNAPVSGIMNDFPKQVIIQKEKIIFLWQTIIYQTIDSQSPFCNASKERLAACSIFQRF